jgi:nucleotide-binding universal stress UspA family protein
MYKKIVVCLDGSDLAEQVLPYAAELVARFGSALVLLRVVPEPVLVTPGIPGVAGVPVVTSRMGRQVEHEERDSETYLESVAGQLLKQHGLQAEGVTLLGSAGPTIVEYATANEVELIALATHGRTGPGRVLFGSVADYVTRHSRLPVLLIRPK